MDTMISTAAKRLSEDERKLAEAAAMEAGLSFEQWLERALKAAIYAPVVSGLMPKSAA